MRLYMIFTSELQVWDPIKEEWVYPVLPEYDNPLSCAMSRKKLVEFAERMIESEKPYCARNAKTIEKDMKIIMRVLDVEESHTDPTITWGEIIQKKDHWL